MIRHVSIGVADVARSGRFFDAVLGAIGLRRLHEGEGYLAYGEADALLWVGQLPQAPAANPGPGLHLCFSAPSREAVDAFHAAALAHGGADNGAPGLRPHYSPDYYAAFVIDPDGWRIEAMHGG
jgi:catechol 2,3-dioxygenase-like lactoylglutathione lyase family enzyme